MVTKPPTKPTPIRQGKRVRRYAAMVYRPWKGQFEVNGVPIDPDPEAKSSGFMEVFDSMEAAVEAYPNAELIAVESRAADGVTE